MDEQPRQPADRRRVIERDESVERRSGAQHPATSARRRSYSWLWVILLLLVVAALAWYALSRGEPQSVEAPELEVPDVEAPDLELPEDEPNIEINVQEQ